MKNSNVKTTNKLAFFCTAILSFALFVSANSNTSLMMYQDDVPEGINNYRLIK